MPGARMHADEVDTDVSLVRKLLVAQFPRWAHLPIVPVRSAGTDNAIYRLGDDMAVRLPRIHWAAELVHKEQRWLPRLASHLPLAIPVPLAKGKPGEGYPWYWSVTPWLAGENATMERLADPGQAATDLAQFIVALQRIDATGGPPAGPANFNRGVPLAVRDADTRACILLVQDLFDPSALTEAWEATLVAPPWQRPPVWIHGDLQSGNLLAVEGRLSAVIDFGCLGVGDPAAELIVAWNLFSADTRDILRAALAVDDATWARGRGWALSVALIALPYYRDTNPVLAEVSRRTIEQVLADRDGGAW
ncbi:MAG: aminoglycoside phosphotransferase family protein [Anaerolineae bacterium]